jgi:hypothetical protein
LSPYPAHGHKDDDDHNHDESRNDNEQDIEHSKELEWVEPSELHDQSL